MRCKVIWLILLLALGACSVKENRSECPCELCIRPQEALATDGNVFVSVIQEGVVVKQGMLSKEEFESGKCRMSVSRKPSVVTVFAGVTEMDLLRGRMLDIRDEHQCDAIYSCSRSASISDNVCEWEVDLHKNYTRLDLRILNLPAGSSFSISGSVQGYDLLDSQPYEGSFNCSRDGDVGKCSLRLPRQLDDGLSLAIQMPGYDTMTVPIGAMIANMGYSFEDEDLLDIAMTLDLQKASISVSVTGWEEIILPVRID